MFNEPALTARFLDGLSDELKDEIFAREIPSHLDLLVELAIRLEKHFDLRGCTQESSEEQRRYPSTIHTFPDPEPMQVGRARNSSAEHQRHIMEGLFLYCSGVGHFAATCTVKARAHQ